MTQIQRRIVKQSGRNTVSRLFNAKADKETIAAWKLELGAVLQIFNVCPVTFTQAVANCPPSD